MPGERLEARIAYMYRDASNYKEADEIVLPVNGSRGEAEALAFAMQGGPEAGTGGVLFVPEDLGLTGLRSRLAQYGSGELTEDDRCWHELLGVEIRRAPEGLSAAERNAEAGISCPAESFEEFAAAFLPEEWHEFDPAAEDYSGPGWRKPSENAVRDCIRKCLDARRAAEDEGPRP